MTAVRPDRPRRIAAVLVVLVVLAAAACSHPKLEPAPALTPAVAPSAARAPTAVAGSFALSAVIQGRTIPTPQPPRRPRGRTAQAPVPAVLQLTPTPVAAPDASAPSSTQLAAAVSLPGYTMPPRGRATQAAAWWPGVADSITVRWVIRQRNAAVSLRGTLRGDTASGDVWYTMLATGSEFQLGTFTAVRAPAPRRAR